MKTTVAPKANIFIYYIYCIRVRKYSLIVSSRNNGIRELNNLSRTLREFIGKNGGTREN